MRRRNEIARVGARPEGNALPARRALAAVTGLLGAELGSFFLPNQFPRIATVDTWLSVALQGFLVLLCAGRYRNRSRRTDSQSPKLGLNLVAAGMLITAASLVRALLHRTAGQVLSAADLVDLAAVAWLYFTLMVQLRGRRLSTVLKITVDGLIAALGSATLASEYLFATVTARSGAGGVGAGLGIAFPVGAGLLAALALAAAAGAQGGLRRLLSLCGLAMTTSSAAAAYSLLHPATFAAASAADLGGPLALVALAAAAWTLPSNLSRPEGDAKSRGVMLPAIGAVTSLSILYTASLGHAQRVAVGFATGTLVAALARLAIRVQEGQDRESARFRSLIDKAWDLIVVAKGEDLEVAFVTPSAERVLGYLPSELHGTSLITHVHPDDVEAMTTLLGSLPGGGEKTAAVEIGMRHRDGEWRIIAWNATNLLEDPSVGGYVLNGSDVTDIRHAATALAAARDAALMASKAKSEFLSTMSHEIRTPMNGVLGLTELLLDSDLTAEQLELATGIRISAEALLGIINDILDFSKIEAGKFELESSPFDLSRVVDNVGRILAANAHKKGLELIIDVAADVPAGVVGDAVRLQQVLLNLGSNAVKFTYEGEVVIRIRLLHADGERVALRFEVADDGIGIAAENQGRLFHAFSQADSSTTRRFGGTGLGLAIARQLVELMGGRIGVNSSLKEGSTFWFEVSLLRSQLASRSVPDCEQARMSAQRALIVDDNATNRRILRDHLRSWGVASAEAANAEEAIALAGEAASQAMPFDIGIIDLNMPAMDGMELAEVLKGDPTTASTQLFLLSSSGQLLGEAECHLRGFAASLTKPVRSSELFNCLISHAVDATVVPPAQASSSTGTDPQQTDDDSGAGGMILLVEDNKMNQLVASKALARLGYSFEIANDGTEAVNAIRAHRCDAERRYEAVLMDCQMPIMDGYEATRLIRRIEGDERHTPIIAMTAAAMEGDRETCLAAGMDDYITKPVNLDAVATVLAHWIRQTQPGPTSPAPPAQSGPAIEADRLEMLGGLDDGDGKLLHNIFGQFVTQTRESRSALVKAITGGDMKTALQRAHAIKGSAATVGASSLAAVSAQIEEACTRGDLHVAAGLLKRFDAEFVRVCQALSELFAAPVNA